MNKIKRYESVFSEDGAKNSDVYLYKLSSSTDYDKYEILEEDNGYDGLGINNTYYDLIGRFSSVRKAERELPKNYVLEGDYYVIDPEILVDMDWLFHTDSVDQMMAQDIGDSIENILNYKNLSKVVKSWVDDVYSELDHDGYIYSGDLFDEVRQYLKRHYDVRI